MNAMRSQASILRLLHMSSGRNSFLHEMSPIAVISPYFVQMDPYYGGVTVPLSTRKWQKGGDRKSQSVTSGEEALAGSLE